MGGSGSGIRVEISVLLATEPLRCSCSAIQRRANAGSGSVFRETKFAETNAKLINL